MAKLNAVIGIDIGTSGTKLVLLDYRGVQCSFYYQDYEMQSPYSGWAEQDPEIWFQAVVKGLRYIQNQADQLNIQINAIGLSGQMHSLVCLDSQMNVLRPAILWADQRSASIVSELNKQFSKETWGRWIGNPLAAGFTLPSWLWLKVNEPDIAERTKYLIQPKDWIRYKLTGNLATEVSDASATGFFDPHAKQWSPNILSLAGLERDNFAEIQPSTHIAGTLEKTVAEYCRMSDTTLVIIGGSDQAMQAVAQGIVEEGDVSVTIGSGGQIFAPIRKPDHDPNLRVHLFCHSIEGMWHLEAATLAAGLSLKWLKKIFGDKDSYKIMADMAAEASAGSEGLFFLPYLNGERTPWMDAEARALFIGLRFHHDRTNLIRAVMEGVLFSLRQSLECLQFSGLSPSVLVASGGATRHSLWNQMAANIFDLDIRVNHKSDASARGAAITAFMGFENVNYQEADKIFGAQSRDITIFTPDCESENYQRIFEDYKKIFPQIMQLRT